MAPCENMGIWKLFLQFLQPRKLWFSQGYIAKGLGPDIRHPEYPVRPIPTGYSPISGYPMLTDNPIYNRIIEVSGSTLKFCGVLNFTSVRYFACIICSQLSFADFLRFGKDPDPPKYPKLDPTGNLIGCACNRDPDPVVWQKGIR